MFRDDYPLYLAGAPARPGGTLDVVHKVTGETVTRVALADAATLDAAIAAAAEAAPAMAALPSWRRQQVLMSFVEALGARHEELSRVLCVEAGKPIRDARVEVTRAIDTFRIAAEEAVRIGGEIVPLDISERATGYEGHIKRFPVGPCAFITPFNFPLNLAAHKMAPALAVGCPFVLKPASSTPVSSLLMGEILAEQDLPAGAFSILPCSGSAAAPLVEDERIALLSFTGSPEVGWDLKSRCGRKKIALELGGNAACIVDAGSDLDYVVPRLTLGAFYQSGQSCISVQRVIAHRSLYGELRERLAAAAAELKTGDPLDEDTFLGPLITRDDADRVSRWIADAVAGGATLVCGGKQVGPFVTATLLEDVPRDAEVYASEVFGPVATLEAFDDFADAVARVNDSRFGLQAGVFTRDVGRVRHAFAHCEVGGVVIGDIPSMRVDSMPYGGVKQSGFGREGIRYAMEEMSEPRLMMINGGYFQLER
ncbi:aldehyde dehydrogenase family protein [bacterium]|nr:aldehyde dehydrogenase family protein [bacterium]